MLDSPLRTESPWTDCPTRTEADSGRCTLRTGPLTPLLEIICDMTARRKDAHDSRATAHEPRD